MILLRAGADSPELGDPSRDAPAMPVQGTDGVGGEIRAIRRADIALRLLLLMILDSKMAAPCRPNYHPPTTPVQHVRVDHRGGDVSVPKELLDRPDIVARLEQARRERVP